MSDAATTEQAILDITASNREWLERRRARIVEAATADARRWFAEHGTETIPDLEFDTPPCSICGEHTDYDDGTFWCDICGVRWEQSGRHGEAEPDHAMRDDGRKDTP